MSESDDERGSGMAEPVHKRFLQTKQKYYFRDDAKKVAFEDNGRRLKTKHNDPAVARSMIEVAEAKGWKSIKVKGSEEYKREVWLQASMKGIDVAGYKPRDTDIARLELLRKETERKGGVAPDRTGQGAAGGLSERKQLVLREVKTIMRAQGASAKAIDKATGKAAEHLQKIPDLLKVARLRPLADLHREKAGTITRANERVR